MIRVNSLKIDALLNQEDNIPKYIANKLKINPKDIKNYQIVKQSLDARNKNQIKYIYTVDIEVANEKQILKKNPNSCILAPKEIYTFPYHNKDLPVRPIIVGSGPAGLMSALVLAEAGFKPIIIERGKDVDSRIKDVEHFWQTNELNENSNVQFGEGGAGTFSDGKLNTLTKDENYRAKKVMETFVKFGAPKEILYSYKPHIGTDILRTVIKNMRKYIISLGGEYHFNTQLTNIKINNNQLVSIEVNHEKYLPCNYLILALGHSSRDTFKMLYDHKLEINAKPFAVGLRIMHPQELINKSQYGEKYYKYLGEANYKLTHQSSNGHGVYTFCMCPGGYVINASSIEKHLAINGMSNYQRNSHTANSAIIVTIDSKDFGNHPLDGLKYQANLEKKAYNLANGQIPIQSLKDYYANKKSTTINSNILKIKGNYSLSNLNELLDNELNQAIKEAITSFNHKLKGFQSDDAILAGIESRTSSPIRIIRNDFFESNIKGIYPAGEGAGYAGGITTSAIDGIKVAEMVAKNIITNYQNK